MDFCHVVAHEQYHFQEARTTPERYKRGLEQMQYTDWEKDRSEIAAELFAKNYVKIKVRQAKGK